jgi:general secretion pathway protein C
MVLPNNISSLNRVIDKLPQQKIAKGIAIFLLLYLAVVMAKLTWSFTTANSVSVFVPKSGNSTLSTNAQNIDISSLKQLHLFGEYNAQAVVPNAVEVESVPETQLNLTLAGVVASNDPQAASAIIANSGKQEVYGIGDKITGTRAVLDQVYFDRVIIKHSGKLETLMLDGIDYNSSSLSNNKPVQQARKFKSGASSTDKKSKDKFIDQRATRLKLSNIRNEISADPGKITDYLRITPSRKDGKIIGYRLMPGRDAEFFKASGLQVGDIAVQMNGYDLTSPFDAAQALQALKTESEVTLMVDRNSDLINIIFSIQN